MSAYFVHLDNAADSSARELAFIKYQRHRDLAIRDFNTIFLNAPCVHAEPIICGMQLALLEVSIACSAAISSPLVMKLRRDFQALGNNKQSCQFYLGGVSDFLVEQESVLGQVLDFLRLDQSNNFSGAALRERHVDSGAASCPSHVAASLSPSVMEQTAALFFIAAFVWNDILCAAAEGRTPALETFYRNLLAEDAFSSVLREITGCDAWVLRNIMEITALEIRKRTQLSNGTLSVRDLVHRACKIEAALQQEMEHLSNHDSNPSEHPNDADHSHTPSDHAIRARVFGHAALIYLNTVISGALTGVPEIHQNICQILSSWEMLSAATNFKYLAWAYCTTASLATRSQRPVFRDIMTNLSLLDAGSGIVQEFGGCVEECWKEIDKHAPTTSNVPCDWREVHKGAYLGFVFL
ncbi:PRO1A C6 Zink-finger protein [Cordyceps javanica]|nr:PRO1A C6 Zink-finger protein [Cordyceps javanica]